MLSNFSSAVYSTFYNKKIITKKVVTLLNKLFLCNYKLILYYTYNYLNL